MPASAKTVDKIYSGKGLDHIDYPIGGLGSGMFCISGTGACSLFNSIVRQYKKRNVR